MVRQASIFLRLQWKTIGRENVDQKQPYVVVCNHQTGLDVLASAHVRNFIQYTPKPSLKVKTASAIFWDDHGIFRDNGLKNIFLRNKTFLFFKIES